MGYFKELYNKPLLRPKNDIAVILITSTNNYNGYFLKEIIISSLFITLRL